MKELTLENGARVRVRPVPPHVEALFNKGIRESIPQEPKPPTVAVEMADGHVEQDIVTSGPLWDVYQIAIAAWEDARNDIVIDAFVGYDVLKRDYAVMSWSWDGEHWRTDVPEDWTFPDALTRAGVEACGNLRVDYIGIELLVTPADVAALDAIATGNTATITDEEAARVRASFRPGDRRGGDATATRGGWFRRLALAFSRRDASGESVGTDA